MTIYTVIRTSHVDDYKRPSTDTSAIITTADYTDAVTVAANTWLEEFQSDFVYDNSFMMLGLVSAFNKPNLMKCPA